MCVCVCVWDCVCVCTGYGGVYTLHMHTVGAAAAILSRGVGGAWPCSLRSFSVPATLPSLSGPHDIACASSPTGSRYSDIATVYLIPYLLLYRRFPSEFHSTTATSPSAHARIHVIAAHTIYKYNNKNMCVCIKYYIDIHVCNICLLSLCIYV